MECFKLLESLDIFGHAGFCIGMERCQLLQNSLTILRQENHFDKCYYWGRINGVNHDYYIAYGFRKECLEGQTYFYRYKKELAHEFQYKCKS
jgi:radial spoke head protein 9